MRSHTELPAYMTHCTRARTPCYTALANMPVLLAGDNPCAKTDAALV